MSKIKDILDLLPERELLMVERAGYELLHRHGYRVKGARRCGRVRARIKRALVRRGHAFGYSCRPGDAPGEWRIFFILRDTAGELVGKSRGFRIQFGRREEPQGEAQCNTANMQGSQAD